MSKKIRAGCPPAKTGIQHATSGIDQTTAPLCEQVCCEPSVCPNYDVTPKWS
ncbi:MAG: hypothetical protein AAFN11_19135 [Chloroflexota bacterium]